MTRLRIRALALLGSSLLAAAQPLLAQKPYAGVHRMISPAAGQRASAAAEAEADSACAARGYSFDFFNGVDTTTGAAERDRQELLLAYGVTAPNGERVKYEVFYNKTLGLRQDLLETFAQRMAAQEQAVGDRMELFWEALHGGGQWTDRIVPVAGQYALLLDSYQQFEQSQLIGMLASLYAASPTADQYAKHRTRIDAQILEGRKIILFAHSQGNLFMNKVFEYAEPKIGAPSIAAIHVAPASPVTHGPWTLGDLDLVINGLRLVGSVPDITDHFPGYLLRPPGLNGERDWMGHGLLEIYMNPAITGPRLAGQVSAALASLRTPVQGAQAGFFTATLTWNGSGDADLHTFEPGGAHVYYASPRGQAGFLDVDDTVGEGPEHYFASCDTTRLQLGEYRFGVNNYDRADGRTAIVQIAGLDGVLATRNLVLGPSQGSAGNDHPTLLVGVTVSKDPETGEYRLAVH